jgi:hypothetical protein
VTNYPGRPGLEPRLDFRCLAVVGLVVEMFTCVDAGAALVYLAYHYISNTSDHLIRIVSGTVFKYGQFSVIITFPVRV